jgi:hypothetical protein
VLLLDTSFLIELEAETDPFPPPLVVLAAGMGSRYDRGDLALSVPRSSGNIV